MKKKIKVGLIRVVTLLEENLLRTHANLLMKNFENLEVETKCIPDQPEGIYDDYTEKIAVPKIVNVAREFEKEGMDIIFISCAADPGVEECRKVLHIPVIGAGSACAAVAYSVGSRIGVLGITEEVPYAMIKVLKDKLVANIKPERVNTTLDLFNEEGKKNALTAAQLLKEKGCDTIALGCTGMSTINIYKKIKENLGIPVIDPVLAAGAIISYLNF
ncbi:aspartate/glutamate racemase family protein [Thermoanaerobacter uzonensis]|uniref:aspartate/glutamate racemase family protein n=1 Tax=Thermoanaerobacter uzonensis TaxID=447593 RepID=UPI003D7678FF